MTLSFLNSPPGQDPVILENIFKATPQRLFEAWTTPAEIIKWFGPATRDLDEADIDLQVGGQWRFAYAANDEHADIMQGEYLLIEAPNRLAFSWTHTRIFNDGRRETTAASKVTVSFEDVAEGTRMRLVHSQVEQEAGRHGVTWGWQISFERLIVLIGG